MHKHVPVEMTSLVQIYLHCLQMKAKVCSWNICWVCWESIRQLTTIEKVNLAQKQDFSHLWLKAMHWCGNALTAAQEIESAHVPFNMLGSWTKTTVRWIWLFATGNGTNKQISWNHVEIWNNSFSYAICLWQPRYFVLLFIAIQVGDLVNIWVLPASRWAIPFDHTILLLFCDRQVFVVVTFLSFTGTVTIGLLSLCPLYH